MGQEPEKRKSEKLKNIAISAVDSRQEDLIDISMEIHRNPELPFEEFKASALLANYLRDNNFNVDYPAYGLETAFKATVGNSGPSIAIMAEYDAVPEIGHGCGHSIIATAAVGAGVALSSIIEEIGGTIAIFGTPAEETVAGAGKALMAKNGAFNSIDAAMMIHPWNSDRLERGYDCGAWVMVNVEYFGKAAHPTDTANAINALDAMLVGFNAFNTLRLGAAARGSLEEGYWGVITKSSDSVGVVPDHTTAVVLPLGRDEEILRALLDKVYGCFKAGANATGARLEFTYDWDSRFPPVRSNRVMSELFDANIRSIRPEWNPITPRTLLERAGTDMGFVSQMTPSIHPWIAITSRDVGFHSVESTAASASEEGHKAMLDGAKAMAMTAIDLITNPEILKEAHDDFEENPA